MESTQIKTDQPSKAFLEKQAKKIKKKIAQAQGAIVRAEEVPFEKIISLEPTEHVLVTHFGNGDEIDQNVLLDFFEERKLNEKVKKLTIFPGINYGHITFESPEDSKSLMDSFQTPNLIPMTFPGSSNPDRMVVFFYSHLACDKLKKYENIEVPEA